MGEWDRFFDESKKKFIKRHDLEMFWDDPVSDKDDRNFRDAMSKTESKIELLLLAAAYTAGPRMHYEYVGFDPSIKQQTGIDLIIEPQAQLGPHRVDFRFERRCYDFGNNSVLIECDGHAFHERTKEQATKDKSRDRYLQTLGHSVLRFTGSEIFNDPFKCVDEIFMFLFARRKRGTH